MQLVFLVQLAVIYRLSAAFSDQFGELIERTITSPVSLSHDIISGPYDLSVNANSDGTTRFFVVGDWGGLPFLPYETPSEVAVAKAMGKMGQALNTSFQLALGDNFYFEGVQSPDDARFQVNAALSMHRNQHVLSSARSSTSSRLPRCKHRGTS